MSYTKNVWVDQVVERPKTYEMTNNADGSVTLIDSFGLVSVLGTPVNADNMNHIEEGIEEHENRLVLLEGESGRANTSLSNLTAEGEKHFLNKAQVTNTLLEVPQRINYTLADGTLTIKAGSVFIVPYKTSAPTYSVGDYFLGSVSGNAFKVADIQYSNNKLFYWLETMRNISLSYAGTHTNPTLLYLRITTSPFYTLSVADSYSGTTDSVSITTSHAFYDTNENKVNVYNSSGLLDETFSLPLLLMHGNGSQLYGYIDQVFNGSGFMGSTVWSDKGVAGLIADGWNSDGSYNNKSVVSDALKLHTFSSGSGSSAFFLADSAHLPIFGSSMVSEVETLADAPAVASGVSRLVYVKSENRWYSSLSGGAYTVTYRTPQFTAETLNGKVQSLTPRTAFRAVDFNNKGQISGWGKPSAQYIDLTLGASETVYTMPANGWLYLDKISTAVGQFICFTNQTSAMDGEYVSVAPVAANHCTLLIPVAQGDRVTVKYNISGATRKFRFIYDIGEV